MSIFLVGGGPDTVTTPVIFDQFMAEARQQAGGSRPPRIAVVLVDHGGSAEYFLPAYLDPMHSRTPSEVTTVLLHRSEDVDPQIAPERAIVGAAACGPGGAAGDRGQQLLAGPRSRTQSHGFGPWQRCYSRVT